ncbi:DUF3225 domain-containing protein [Acuticoccus sediminis]|uniref:DUF3225 domain-containing protein n=2 Tax=Acuticoccus sediminis TaxID=2184697 RepID=A0A8B2NU60_9HYPH|nr:AtzH-like domain-containing protein [Acuticoccus sediminis]RAI02511.1 DUF3225 domain-containing protein [Acuticoccus sediminis]
MDEAKRQAVEAEVREAFDAYERALNTNDVAALIDAFAEGPRTVRMMNDSGLFGIDEIAAFRKGRDVADIERTLTRVEIVGLSPEIAVASATYTRKVSGKKGAQTQVWQRGDEGWRIVSAHVSLGG